MGDRRISCPGPYVRHIGKNFPHDAGNFHVILYMNDKIGEGEMQQARELLLVGNGFEAHFTIQRVSHWCTHLRACPRPFDAKKTTK